MKDLNRPTLEMTEEQTHGHSLYGPGQNAWEAAQHEQPVVQTLYPPPAALAPPGLEEDRHKPGIQRPDGVPPPPCLLVSQQTSWAPHDDQHPPPPTEVPPLPPPPDVLYSQPAQYSTFPSAPPTSMEPPHIHSADTDAMPLGTQYHGQMPMPPPPPDDANIAVPPGISFIASPALAPLPPLPPPGLAPPPPPQAVVAEPNNLSSQVSSHFVFKITNNLVVIL